MLFRKKLSKRAVTDADARAIEPEVLTQPKKAVANFPALHSNKPRHIFLSCFDVSGDHHAADLVRYARQHFSGKFVFSVLGGLELKNLQSNRVKDIAFLEDTVTASSIGLLEGLPYLFSSLGLYKKVKKFLQRTSSTVTVSSRKEKNKRTIPNPFAPPAGREMIDFQNDTLTLGFGNVDIFLCIDGQGRNFALAALAKKMGCKIAYYFAPPVFIWGKWNVKKLRSFHKVFTVFAANNELLEKGGVKTKFVGHPFSQTLSELKKQGLKAQKKRSYLVSIFPGSRFQEINVMLPLFLEVASALNREIPMLRFAISIAHVRYKKTIEEHIETACRKTPANVSFFREVKMEYGKWDELLASSRFAFCCSGTVTLKAAFFGVPHVIAYRISKLSTLLARLLVYVKYIGIANILFEKEVSKELINKDANVDALLREAVRWLKSPKLWKEQHGELKKISKILRGRQCLKKLCNELQSM